MVGQSPERGIFWSIGNTNICFQLSNVRILRLPATPLKRKCSGTSQVWQRLRRRSRDGESCDKLQVLCSFLFCRKANRSDRWRWGWAFHLRNHLSGCYSSACKKARVQQESVRRCYRMCSCFVDCWPEFPADFEAFRPLRSPRRRCFECCWCWPQSTFSASCSSWTQHRSLLSSSARYQQSSRLDWNNRYNIFSIILLSLYWDHLGLLDHKKVEKHCPNV